MSGYSPKYITRTKIDIRKLATGTADSTTFLSGDMTWKRALTAVSIVSANGFSATINNPTTTPEITLKTSVSGMLKGDGTGISAGVAGTDYSLGTSSLATGVLKSTTTTGVLSIAIPGTDYSTEFNRKPYHGIADRSQSTLSMVGSTFKITPTITTFDFYYQGTKYTVPEQTVPLAETAGLHFIYFNSSGVLVESINAWTLKGAVPVSTAFWNGSIWAYSNERHNSTRDLDWHEWAHETIGARYESGLEFLSTGVAPNTFSVAPGTIDDEDIEYDITPTKTTCRTWYQNGAGSYTFLQTTLVAPIYPFIWNSGTSRIRYSNSSAAYALTDMSVARFINVWVYASTDVEVPIYAFTETLAGTGGYTTVASARAVGVPTLSGLGLTPELKLLYRVIYKGDGTWQEQTDYRTSSSLPSGSIATPTAISVSITPTGVVTETNVQAAIDRLASPDIYAFAAAQG